MNSGLLTPLSESVAAQGLITNFYSAPIYGITLGANGKYAYIAYDTVYIFSVGQDGGLTFQQPTSSAFNFPSILFDPSGQYAYSLSATSNQINIFNVSESGGLTPSAFESNIATGPSPVGAATAVK